MKYKYNPKNNLEKFGETIYSLLVENFPQTFFVGGMVRDSLLKREVKDVDIATSATPEEVVDLLKKHYVEMTTGYINLGVVLAFENHLTVSISTFRKDLKADTRYPQVKFVKDLKTDATRRDFTVNSLYLSSKKNQITDHFKGIKDLKEKKIRFIGKPSERIKEDPLRIVRALRFCLVLNFKLEKQTKAAIKKHFNLVSELTNSRIKKELEKVDDKNYKKILKEVINNPQSLDKFFK